MIVQSKHGVVFRRWCKKCDNYTSVSEPHLPYFTCQFCAIFEPAGIEIAFPVKEIVRLRRRRWWQFWK